jgi:hypothetical protein
MKRPLTFIVGTAAAALLFAAVGASAHGAGPFFSRLTGAQGTHFGDNASAARTESPEPTDSPEAKASPKAKPAEPPEASPSPRPTESPETDSDETTDTDVEASPSANPTGDEGGGGGGD